MQHNTQNARYNEKSAMVMRYVHEGMFKEDCHECTPSISPPWPHEPDYDGLGRQRLVQNETALAIGRRSVPERFNTKPAPI